MKLEISTLVEQTQFYGADRIKVIEKDDYTALLLADGAGGMSGAKEAAEYIIQAFQERIEKIDSVPHIDNLELTLRSLDGYVQRDKNAGSTTFVVVFITEDQMYGVSVGDSRCWLYTDQYNLELTAHQYKQPLLGSGDAIPVAFGPFESSGTILIGSDGLFDYVKKDVIDEVMTSDTSIEAKPKQLIEFAKKNNSKLIDDVSIIACHIR